MRRIARASRVLVGATAAALALMTLGYLAFAMIVTRDGATPFEPADGIVVLTGETSRIDAAARLLDAGRAKRLLISGVNRRTSREDLRRLMRLADGLFDCCVDIGYGALDTSGNADEARAWAQSRRFSSLIVVTASYHMPRSLAELSRSLPGVRLIPYPVVPKALRTETWWRRLAIAQLLAEEYLKFLPSAARWALSRVLRSRDGDSAAGASAPATTACAVPC